MPNKQRNTLGRINGMPVHGPLPKPKQRPRRKQARDAPNNYLAPARVPLLPPVSYANKSRNVGPRMVSRGNVCTVAHKELVTTVVNGNSPFFTATSFSINPGLPSMFPWLSNIAGNFEKYKFSRLHFTYRPFVSTSTQGQVIAAIDLDVLDATPTSLKDMWNFMNRQDSPIWSTFTISTPEYQPELYVRVSTPPTGTDQKTYDCGQLIVATNNCIANQSCGIIEVDYVVHLHTPQVSTTFSSLAGFNSVATTNLLGLLGNASNPPTLSGSLGTIIMDSAVNRLLLPVVVGRTFLVTIDVVGATITNNISITIPNTNGNAGLQGAASASFNAGRATYANTLTCTALPTAGSNRGYFTIDIACPGATAILVGGTTFTASPWQQDLVFP